MSSRKPDCDDFQARQVTGLRFSPLPSESSFSALTRLGWMNSFSRRDLADYIIGEDKQIPLNVEFISPKWLKTDLMSRLLGWRLPSDLEREIAYKFDTNLRALWEFRNLKFCPVCLEGLYHSYWFQLIEQKYCPLHHCELLVQCVYCGEISPSYAFQTSVFNNPYICCACKLPFCGATPNVDAHEDMRNYRIIGSVFYDHDRWLNRYDHKKFNRLFPNEEFHGWSRWCDTQSIRTHFVNQTSEMPHEIAPIFRNDLIVLEWRIRMFDWKHEYRRRSLKLYNCRELRCVLFMFLRHIKEWAFESVSAEMQMEIRKKFHIDKRLNPHEYDLKQLSYLIVECFNNWIAVGEKSDLYPMDSWNNRIPRVAYCAYLYGFYAGIYHHLWRIRYKGQRMLESISSLCVSEYLIAICDVSGIGEHSGRVIFPEVPGMPILLKSGRRKDRLSK
jgi:hypothetical protein